MVAFAIMLIMIMINDHHNITLPTWPCRHPSQDCRLLKFAIIIILINIIITTIMILINLMMIIIIIDKYLANMAL